MSPPQNPDDGVPENIFSPEGWSPESVTENATVEIIPNPGVELTVVNGVDLVVENVDTIIVQITTPTGEVENFTQV